MLNKRDRKNACFDMFLKKFRVLKKVKKSETLVRMYVLVFKRIDLLYLSVIFFINEFNESPIISSFSVIYYYTCIFTFLVNEFELI